MKSLLHWIFHGKDLWNHVNILPQNVQKVLHIQGHRQAEFPGRQQDALFIRTKVHYVAHAKICLHSDCICTLLMSFHSTLKLHIFFPMQPCIIIYISSPWIDKWIPASGEERFLQVSVPTGIYDLEILCHILVSPSIIWVNIFKCIVPIKKILVYSTTPSHILFREKCKWIANFMEWIAKRKEVLNHF